jgi:hypothetical protein
MHRSQVARTFPLKLPIRHRAAALPHARYPVIASERRTQYDTSAQDDEGESRGDRHLGVRQLRKSSKAGACGWSQSTPACHARGGVLHCLAPPKPDPSSGTRRTPVPRRVRTTAHAIGSVAVACRFAAAPRCFDCSAREYQRCSRCWVMSSSVAASGVLAISPGATCVERSAWSGHPGPMSPRRRGARGWPCRVSGRRFPTTARPRPRAGRAFDRRPSRRGGVVRRLRSAGF